MEPSNFLDQTSYLIIFVGVHHVARPPFLLAYRHFRFDLSIPPAMGKYSWREPHSSRGSDAKDPRVRGKHVGPEPLPLNPGDSKNL